MRQLAGLHGQLYPRSMRCPTIIAVLLAVAACSKSVPQQQPVVDNKDAAAPDAGIKGVHRDHAGQPAPSPPFNDSDGKQVQIADFTGKPVLVNLWATWCAPCVKELPTLDELAQHGAVQVVAVSQDSGPHASVVAFLQSHQIGKLEPYQDSKMALSGALGPDTVLPTSILIGADGKEVWRYVGDLDWIGPKATKLLAEASAAPSKPN